MLNLSIWVIIVVVVRRDEIHRLSLGARNPIRGYRYSTALEHRLFLACVSGFFESEQTIINSCVYS